MLEVIPGRINGTVSVPGSKSYTNRSLVAASLAEGKSILRNPLFSDDTLNMAHALKLLGVSVEKKRDSFIVLGTGGKLRAGQVINAGGSGTAIRFLAALSALAQGRTILTGDSSLLRRPMQGIVEGLTQLGVAAKTEGGFPPITIEGGSLKGGSCTIKGTESSQYFSSLLLVAAYAQHDVTIKADGEIVSKPYIDMTIDTMKSFGVKVINKGYRNFFVKSNQRYQAGDYVIEGDASSASYFFAAAALAGGKVTVKGINPDSMQPDIKFIDIMQQMGCRIKKGTDWIALLGECGLKGIDIDMKNMPDIVPTLSVVASFAKGKTILRNVSHLRHKESDRINAVTTELRKLGVHVEEAEDTITIHGTGPHGNAEIETYNDHRIAMAFSLFGLIVPGVRIKDPGCINKSFPGYWKELDNLGVSIRWL